MTLMVAKNTAAVPRIVVIISPEPEDKSAPTRVIPDIAFAPDIKGVCNVEGTLVISSIPKKIAKTKINNNKIILKYGFFRLFKMVIVKILRY